MKATTVRVLWAIAEGIFYSVRDLWIGGRRKRRKK